MRDREERDAVEIDLPDPRFLPECQVCEQMPPLVGREAQDAACQKRCNSFPLRPFLCIVVLLSFGRRLGRGTCGPGRNRKKTQEYGREPAPEPYRSHLGTAVALL